MNYLETLTTRALIGTARDCGALPVPPDILADFRADTSASAESAVLRGAAAFYLLDRAGRRPVKKQNAPSLPSDDARPICSGKAATLLRRILDGPHALLLLEWLEACVRAGQRPPPAAIAQLLDAATRQTEHRMALRTPAMQATGPLGLWLCQLNSDWSALSSEDASANVAQVWQTGAKAARIAALRRLRAADPAAALVLLQSTFASEPAADRAAFVEILATGLSSADESFLESVLADRSREVRAAAAKLLARLPNSALVARMIARVDPLVHFTPEPKKLLRGGKDAQLVFELPAAYDAQMKADGIEAQPNPSDGYGARQFWRMQMLSLIPPSHWSKKFHTAPAHLLAAVPEEDAALIHFGFRNAAENCGDADWAEALIRLPTERGFLDAYLLMLLPPPRRHALIYDLLMERDLSGTSVLDLLSAGPLDARSARAVMKWVADQSQSRGAVNYELARLMGLLAMSAPPALLQEFEVAWPAESLPAARGEYERFFATLSIRQNIQKEFSK